MANLQMLRQLRDGCGDAYRGDPPEISDIPITEGILFGYTHGVTEGATSIGIAEDSIWELAAQKAIENDVGDWAEFGVWNGLSARHFLEQLPEHRNFYLFDSFEGLPEPWKDKPAGYFSVDAIPCFDDERVIIKKGWFSNTLPFDKTLGFVHIDSDIYSSAKQVLDGIKVTTGSLILFDEYFGYPEFEDHEYKALQEWDVPYRFVARDKTARVLIEVK